MLSHVRSWLVSTRSSLIGGLILGAIAWALLALHISRVLEPARDLLALIITTTIPIMLSLTLFVGAIGVYRYQLDEWALQISGWTLFGILLFTGVLGIEFLYLQSISPASSDFRIVLINVAASGAVLGFLIGLYDAHHRQVRQELQDEYDRTLSLSQRLSVLARILRHDLRNQLNIILGNAERLHAPSDDDSQPMQMIRRAGDELVTISEQIHQFSAILQDPRPDQSHQQMDLTQIVEQAIETIYSRYDPDAVMIESTLPETVPVTASPFLHQAVVELLENAIIHTDADTPQIAITVAHTPDAALGAELRITDNGPGIPERERAVLNTEVETALEHSTGVGLWLVRWVVDASDGEFDILPADADGTTVRIQLPLAASRPEDDSAHLHSLSPA